MITNTQHVGVSFFLNHACPKNRGKGVFLKFSGQNADRVSIKRGILKTASAFFIKKVCLKNTNPLPPPPKKKTKKKPCLSTFRVT